jgi:hypothetical protein
MFLVPYNDPQGKIMEMPLARVDGHYDGILLEARTNHSKN